MLTEPQVVWARATRPRKSAGTIEQGGVPPQPTIVPPASDQTRPDRVKHYVRHPLRQAVLTAQYMVKGLILPNATPTAQSLVDPVRRLALDRLHDFRY